MHTLFRAYGLFGEAGYPRYMVSVAPAIAVLTLAGWNRIALLSVNWSPFAAHALGWMVLSVSLALSFLYLDSFSSARDPVAIREMSDWFHQHPEPYKRLIWSNARMCIDFGLTLRESPSLGSSNSGSYSGRAAKCALGARSFSGTTISDRIGLVSLPLKLRAAVTRPFAAEAIRYPDWLRAMPVGNREIDLSLLLKP